MRGWGCCSPGPRRRCGRRARRSRHRRQLCMHGGPPRAKGRRQRPLPKHRPHRMRARRGVLTATATRRAAQRADPWVLRSRVQTVPTPRPPDCPLPSHGLPRRLPTTRAATPGSAPRVQLQRRRDRHSDNTQKCSHSTAVRCSAALTCTLVPWITCSPAVTCSRWHKQPLVCGPPSLRRWRVVIASRPSRLDRTTSRGALQSWPRQLTSTGPRQLTRRSPHLSMRLGGCRPGAALVEVRRHRREQAPRGRRLMAGVPMPAARRQARSRRTRAMAPMLHRALPMLHRALRVATVRTRTARAATQAA